MIKTSIICDICQTDISQDQEAVGLMVKRNDPKGTILIKLELCKDHAMLITDGIAEGLNKLAPKAEET